MYYTSECITGNKDVVIRITTRQLEHFKAKPDVNKMCHTILHCSSTITRILKPPLS